MSDPKIKVIMFGKLGAGKTCYMISMYAFMKLGINGFTFNEQDLDRDIELTAMWEALIEHGKWPEQNLENKEYTLNFNYGFKPLLEVDFLDYRGPSTSADIEVKYLQDYIQECSCVFYFLSGEYLKEPQKLNPTKKYKTKKFDKYLTKTYQELGCSKPVAIIVTKYDLCKQLSHEKLIENIKELFPELFSQNSDSLVMICPVSLGLNLAKTSNTEEIEPINMHLPIAFVFYSTGIHKALDQALYEIRDRRKHSWNYLIPGISFPNPEQPNYDEIEKELEEKKKNIIKLFQEIPRGYIFIGGHEVDIRIS